jgi:apolipoprotein D and lipocalin family protein
MQRMFKWVFLLSSANLLGAAETLQTVPEVNLERFAGKWYEISRLRPPWELQCATNNTFTYTVLSNDKMSVLNECYEERGFSKNEKAKGTAEIIDQTTRAKFKVTYPYTSRYKWIFDGEYWVIQLAADYSYTVLASPDQTHLWILSRTPQMDPETYQKVLDQVTFQLPTINILNVLPTKQEEK